LEGMFQGPAADEEFRASLAGVVVGELHSRLGSVDPPAASRIDRNDRKRITRALEVFHLTGKPISSLQTQWLGAASNSSYCHNPILIGLRWSSEAINKRINARVRQMFSSAQGTEDLMTETRKLLEHGKLGPQASQALGTKQVLEHLAGRCTLEEAVEHVKIETRRYAKAQRTWLKRYRGVHWLDAEGASPMELTAKAGEIVQKELSLGGQR
jgi:tRNA dimethylallyltransferase